jgi:hypothetical protein
MELLAFTGFKKNRMGRKGGLDYTHTHTKNK